MGAAWSPRPCARGGRMKRALVVAVLAALVVALLLSSTEAARASCKGNGAKACTPTPTITVTPSQTPTPTASPTPSPTPSPSPTPTPIPDFNPHDPVQCAAYNGTQIYGGVDTCAHVAHTGELRIAAKFDPAAPPAMVQLWAEVMASWSAAAHIDVGFVGATDAINCVTDGDGDQTDDPWVDWTVMHICIQPWETDPTVSTGGYAHTIFDAYPYPHGAGGRMFLPVTSTNPAYDYRLVACHEIGHYLGVNHGNTGGCMTPVGIPAQDVCPGALALAMLGQLYEHDDAYQVQVQAPEPFAIIAENGC